MAVKRQIVPKLRSEWSNDLDMRKEEKEEKENNRCSGKWIACLVSLIATLRFPLPISLTLCVYVDARWFGLE